VLDEFDCSAVIWNSYRKEKKNPFAQNGGQKKEILILPRWNFADKMDEEEDTI
jgi:hypothetical protein